jgi:hypothetical protein
MRMVSSFCSKETVAKFRVAVLTYHTCKPVNISTGFPVFLAPCFV